MQKLTKTLASFSLLVFSHKLHSKITLLRNSYKDLTQFCFFAIIDTFAKITL